MDRHSETDAQALLHIVVRLLSLAALAEASACQPVRQRIFLLAVLRHAASVAFAYADHLHAPVNCSHVPAPASGETEATHLAAIFRALAFALAFPARQAFRAARLAVRRTPYLPCECPTGRFRVTARPRFADTS